MADEQTITDLVLPDRIPALTVWQPWAWALAMGWKPVENRGRRLPLQPGSILAIHAGQKYDRGVQFPEGEYRAALDRIKSAAREGRDDPASRLWRSSAVLCLMRFTGSHTAGSARCVQAAGDVDAYCTPWSVAGQVHNEVKLLAALPELVQCGGSRGIWYLPSDVDAKVRAQFGPFACDTFAMVDGIRFPCRSHDGDVHHFASRWPACPAPFCMLAPDHCDLHDIPSGKAVIVRPQETTA